MGTFVSEEVSCLRGRAVHVGVYGITGGQHEAIAPPRRAEALFAYLAEQRIGRGQPLRASRTETPDFHYALSRLDLVEARNGMMSTGVNVRAARAARAARLAAVGGSDAHTLASVARAYTVVPQAETREEFLDGLRRGLTVPAGDSGSYGRLTADIVRIVAGAYRALARDCARDPASAARFAALLSALPLLPLLPLATAGVFLHEQLFARYHERALLATRARRRGPARSGPFGPAPAPTATA